MHRVFYTLNWAFIMTVFFLRAWILAIFRHFWAFLSHFFIFLRAFIHQKLFSIQGLYVFIKILQQKKTDGEKWAHNNFANGLAEEWALSPGVCCTLTQLQLVLFNPFLRFSSRLNVSAWVGPCLTPACCNFSSISLIYKVKKPIFFP